MLFERGTGDVLLDSWNDGTLGSVEDAEEGAGISKLPKDNSFSECPMISARR